MTTAGTASAPDSMKTSRLIPPLRCPASATCGAADIDGLPRDAPCHPPLGDEGKKRHESRRDQCDHLAETQAEPTGEIGHRQR